LKGRALNLRLDCIFVIKSILFYIPAIAVVGFRQN